MLASSTMNPSASSGASSSRRNSSPLYSSRRWMVRASQPVASLRTLGGAAGGGAQLALHSPAGKQSQHKFHNGGFAGAGGRRFTTSLAALQRGQHGAALLGIQANALFSLQCGPALRHPRARGRRRRFAKAKAACRRRRFRPQNRGGKKAASQEPPSVEERVFNTSFSREARSKSRSSASLCSQPSACAAKAVSRSTGRQVWPPSAAASLREYSTPASMRKGESAAMPAFLGDGVGGFEADAVDVFDELIGVELHDVRRGRPVHVVEFDALLGGSAPARSI